MFLSSGSTAAALNKVPGNLCLQPPPGETARPAGTLVLSTFTSPGSQQPGWQGTQRPAAAGPVCTGAPSRPALDHTHCTLPSRLDTG